MPIVRVGALPGEALMAAARFHADALPRARAALADDADDLVLVFCPADYAHRGWRLAAVQGLAREYAPLRVNAVESDDEAAIAAGIAYLASAGGVTGQVLRLDGTGAGEVHQTAE